MSKQKFYWLKLKSDFFKRHDIRIIEAMPNGKDYILFYMKLLLESVAHEGSLRFSDTVPYNEQMLSVVTDTNIDIVRAAMKLFVELKMIEVLDDSTIYMNEVQKMIGTESKWAEYKRQERSVSDGDAKPALLDNVQRMSKTCPIEIDKEKEIKTDKEKRDISITRHKYGEYKNVLLSDEDLSKLKAEFSDWEERIERLSSYIASTGKKYKSHLATIRNWARNDKPKAVDRDYGDPEDFFK